MCYQQFTIPTRSRLISRLHRQPLLQQCACGQCFECQTLKHQEWLFRIYHEWKDCIAKGGYIFFDTLTYDDEHLPHISDFFDIPLDLDNSCFSRKDLRSFVTSLTDRIRNKYGADSSLFRRFIAAEYGKDEDYYDEFGRLRKGTIRPHYHCLFFCMVPDLDVVTLRDMIHDVWSRGRTDNVRFYGKHANVFRGNNSDSQLAVSNYVAKYIQKDTSYRNMIDKRIDYICDNFASQYSDSIVVKCSHIDIDNINHNFVDEIAVVSDDSCNFFKSQTFKRFRASLVRSIGQFHLQNDGFGASALSEFDLNEIISTGMVTMPDKQHIVRKLPLPLYYKRKLFYNLVKFENGFRVWVPNDLGKKYISSSRVRLVNTLANRYRNLNDLYKLDLTCDFDLLAKYVVYYKGRNNGLYGNDVDFCDLLSMPSNLRLFNYCTSTDKQLFHISCLSSEFVGMNGIYLSSNLENAIPFAHYIKKHLIDDSFLPEFRGFDSILSILNSKLYEIGLKKQQLYDYKKQHKSKQLSLFV